MTCLHADDGEHEDEEDGDEHDVADGLDGHDDALHHVLESLGTVDGAERPQHAQHTEDLHHGDGAGAAMREDAVTRGFRVAGGRRLARAGRAGRMYDLQVLTPTLFRGRSRSAGRFCSTPQTYS